MSSPNPEETPSSEALTESLIEAASKCYIEYGIGQTGMKEVAQMAGVARSTLYRYFSSRDELLIATVEFEMVKMNASIQKKLKKYDKPADIIVEGLLLALKEMPKKPLLKAVLISDQDARARRVVWQSKSVVKFGEALMQQVFQPAIDSSQLQSSVKLEYLVEWLYRILLSYLTLPRSSARNDNELRAMLHALLIPVLLR